MTRGSFRQDLRGEDGLTMPILDLLCSVNMVGISELISPLTLGRLLNLSRLEFSLHAPIVKFGVIGIQWAQKKNWFAVG